MKTLFNQKKVAKLLFFTFVVILVIRIILLGNNVAIFPGEHCHIAHSLVSGNGYGNPFNFPTGTTAWTLPLSVFFTASVIYFTGMSVFGFVLLSIIKFVVLSLAFYYLLKLINPSDDKINNFLFYLIFLFYVYLNFTSIIRANDDTWIAASLMIFLLIFSCEYYKSNSLFAKVGLAIVSLLIPIGQPALVVPLILLLLLPFINLIRTRYFRKKSFPFIQNQHVKIRHFFLWGLAFFLLTGIWAFRNYKVFHAPVLSKSNLWFEFYMCNVIDRNGVSSGSSWVIAHPYDNSQLCREILKQGELQWLEKYKQIGLKYIKTHQDEYYRKFFNRIKNGLVFVEFRNDCIESPVLKELSDNDERELSDHTLIWDSHWLCLEMNENEFVHVINLLKIDEKQKIINAWKEGKKIYQKKMFAVTYLVGGIMMAGIPFFGLVFLSIVGYRRTLVSLIAVIYLLYLATYFFVSHEIRYQIPLFILQSAIVLLNIEYLRSKFFKDYENSIACSVL
jgi:hypothetical protein